MKLSTKVNVDVKDDLLEKELSIEVDSEVAYFSLDNKKLFIIDYENLADFMEAIFKLFSKTVVPSKTTEVKE